MKLKKRITALIIGLVAVMLFSFFYIFAVGGHYTLRTGSEFPERNSPPKTKVVIENENVVKCTGVRLDNKALVLDLEAVGKGDTGIKVSYTHGGETYVQDHYEICVNAFGTIIEKTFNMIGFNGFQAVIYAIIAQLFLIEIIMLWMYIDYRRSGDFSYGMVACGGVSIYVGALLAYLVYSAINKTINSLTYFIILVEDAGELFLFLLTPFMLLISFLLTLSNIWLMRHEGFRPVNALGILFAVLWVIGDTLAIGSYFFPAISELPFYEVVVLPSVYIVTYLECMFLSTVACAFVATKYKTPLDRDYIIILGCAIRKDGTLTPLLKGRVDSAVSFEKRQYEKTGRHAVFVPSGGQGADEVISEGEAMENYLLSVGIPSEQIVREDKSVNTFENMKLSKKVIESREGDIEGKKIAFATTNYHLFRGYILARKNGIDAKGISAKTKQYFFPNAFLREFVGLLADKKLHHIAFVILTVAFFVLLDHV